MKTVLMVEDQWEFRAIQSAYLERHGYRVLTADDGDSALEAARSQQPDLILLDHSLPRRTGLEIARELKRDDVTAGIPIVMITAHTYGSVGRKAREVGCAGFLGKPCEPRRLLEEVERHAGAATRP